jgi:hypothetical protein
MVRTSRWPLFAARWKVLLLVFWCPLLAAPSAGAADAPPTLSIGDAQSNEGHYAVTPLAFEVTLSSPSLAEVAVDVTAIDGTAAQATKDFQAHPQRLTFAPGSIRQTYIINLIGDAQVEDDETFTVVLANPANAGLSRATGIGTIKNDDLPGASYLVMDPVGTPEGNSGPTTTGLYVRLNPTRGEEVRVAYRTADDTATVSDSDYQAASGILVFAPGDSMKLISLTVNGDTRDEGGEQFTVLLEDAVGAVIGSPRAMVIINDDEPPPQLTIQPASLRIREGDSGPTPVMVTLSLDKPPIVRFSATFSTTARTAYRGADYYVALGRYVYFAPGETMKTVQVAQVNGDLLSECDEGFMVQVGVGQGASGPVGEVGVIIEDDDPPGDGGAPGRPEVCGDPFANAPTGPHPPVVDEGSGFPVDPAGIDGGAVENPAIDATTPSDGVTSSDGATDAGGTDAGGADAGAPRTDGPLADTNASPPMAATPRDAGCSCQAAGAASADSGWLLFALLALVLGLVRRAARPAFRRRRRPLA